MGKKDSGGAKSKRKNNGPAEARYKAEMRWEKNKNRRIATEERRQWAIAVRHLRKGIVGFNEKKRLRSG